MVSGRDLFHGMDPHPRPVFLGCRQPTEAPLPLASDDSTFLLGGLGVLAVKCFPFNRT
jgi:hypothetical protein